MHFIGYSIIGALALAAATSPVQAQSLEMKKFQAAQQADLDKALALTNQRCGTKIIAGFDWKTFDDPDLLKKGATPYCVAALDAIEDLCSDAIGKEAIQSKVKALTCVGAATPTADISDDGKVTFGFALAPNQNKLLVRGILEKKL
jgi:hypothetical protein